MKKTKRETRNIPLVRCVWGLICGMASIDKDNNNISLFNVIDQINLPKKIFLADNKDRKILFNHEVVVLLRRVLDIEVDSSEFNIDIKLKLVSPSSSILQEILTPLIFQKNKKNMHFRFNINGLMVTESGDYCYIMEVQRSEGKDNFDKVFEIPFNIKSV